MHDDELRARAREVRERAYAPYSHFRVGAALLAADGRVFAGCNVENASYGATICAERGALLAAAAAGARAFTRIVIVADGERPAAPCGLCRQALSEFAPDLDVQSIADDGTTRRWLLRDLLPDAFTLAPEPPAAP